MIKLQTPRLTLRPPRLEDIQCILMIEASDGYEEYVGRDPDPKKSVERLARAIRELDSRGYGMLGIVITAEHDELIGICGLMPSPTGNGRDVELVCAIRGDCRRHGFALEASERVLSWGLNELGLARVYGRVDEANQPSRLLVERIGMTRDGTRSDMLRNRREFTYVMNAATKSSL